MERAEDLPGSKFHPDAGDGSRLSVTALDGHGSAVPHTEPSGVLRMQVQAVLRVEKKVVAASGHAPGVVGGPSTPGDEHQRTVLVRFFAGEQLGDRRHVGAPVGGGELVSVQGSFARPVRLGAGPGHGPLTVEPLVREARDRSKLTNCETARAGLAVTR